MIVNRVGTLSNTDHKVNVLVIGFIFVTSNGNTNMNLSIYKLSLLYDRFVNLWMGIQLFLKSACNIKIS